MEDIGLYRNVFNIKNENIAYGITPAAITSGHSQYAIYRTDNEGVTSVVAYLTLTVSGSTVKYSVTYEGQNILTGYDLGTLGIATSGTLGTFASGSLVDMSKIVICDQFRAETSANEHSSSYEYVLREVTGSGSPIYSNTTVVPVFKTFSTIDGNYTLSQVLNDTNAKLLTNNLSTNVEMRLSSNPGIYYYALMRGVNSNPGTMISKLQHRTDGSYLEMLDVLPHYAGQVINMDGESTKMIDRYDNSYNRGESNEYVSYHPVLWVFGNDRLKNDGENSYGSTIWHTGVGYLDLHANSYPSAYGGWFDENGDECMVFSPVITLDGMVPEVDGVEYEPFMYRIWRETDGVRGYTVDPISGDFINDPTSGRERSKLIAEEMTDAPSVTFGTGNELDFGAKADADINFRARFYYVKKGQGGSDKPMYCVVETYYNWNNDVTGIVERQASEVVSKTYYNMMGVASNKPYDGLNIVVMRYSDGTTRSVKVIY